MGSMYIPTQAKDGNLGGLSPRGGTLVDLQELLPVCPQGCPPDSRRNPCCPGLELSPGISAALGCLKKYLLFSRPRR